MRHAFCGKDRLRKVRYLTKNRRAQHDARHDLGDDCRLLERLQHVYEHARGAQNDDNLLQLEDQLERIPCR